MNFQIARTVQELWVSMLEKAFFKHMTCVQMSQGASLSTFGGICDVGETIFSLIGGIHEESFLGEGGKKDLTSQPQTFWEKLRQRMQNGDLVESNRQL